MRWIDFFALALLIVALGIGVFVLLDNWPGKVQEFSTPDLNNGAEKNYSNGTQFYSNMRYPDKKITYTISTSCDAKKERSIKEAFSIIAEETILEFEQANEYGEISVLCSNIAPEPEDAGHFIAGEGGPKDIYSSGEYHVITSGKISLFRDEKCDEPKIAIHEILHALGFDHNNNPSSIMYPITSCQEEIDSYIVDDINRLYSIPSAPDLEISNARAEKAGRLLAFEVEISNSGFIDARDVNLTVFANDEEIKDFAFKTISFGSKKQIQVSNLQIPRNTERVSFEAYLTDGSREITLDNNRVELNLIKQE